MLKVRSLDLSLKVHGNITDRTMGRQGEKRRFGLTVLRGVPTTPHRSTSAEVSRDKWEACCDTNWWCTYYSLPKEGHTFAARVSRWKWEGVSRYFSNISGSGVNVTFLKYLEHALCQLVTCTQSQQPGPANLPHLGCRRRHQGILHPSAFAPPNSFLESSKILLFSSHAILCSMDSGSPSADAQHILPSWCIETWQQMQLSKTLIRNNGASTAIKTLPESICSLFRARLLGWKCPRSFRWTWRPHGHLQPEGKQERWSWRRTVRARSNVAQKVATFWVGGLC